MVLEARELNRRRRAEKHPLQVAREGESLLLAGTVKGHVAVIEPLTGKVRWSEHGHQGKVIAIACNPKRNYIVSASTGQYYFIDKILFFSSYEVLSI